MLRIPRVLKAFLPQPAPWLALGGVAAICIAATACTAVQDDLGHATTAYEEARYESALTWLKSLERDAPTMEQSMQARYYYLRGMTAYRLGQADEARHFLVLSREVAGSGTALPRDWRRSLDRTLDDLDDGDASEANLENERPS